MVLAPMIESDLLASIKVTHFNPAWHNDSEQAQLGVPHSETQVELQSYLNWGQVSVGGDTAHFVDGGGNNWGGVIAQY